MKNKNLWIIFTVLLTLYLISKVFSGKDHNRSFNPELFAVDTTAVTLIEISSQADDFVPFKLERSGNAWTISNGILNAKAESNAVNSILAQLPQIKATRIAAKKKEKWANFEIEEDKAKAHIKVFQGKKLAANFWLGGFRFNQQNQSAISFVRKSEADDVYVVDGFLSMSMGQGIDSYRNKSMVKFNEGDITSLTFTKNGVSSNLKKEGNTWITDSGLTLDSLKMANYLKRLSTYNAPKFADDFSASQADNSTKESLVIGGNNMLDPISINCYQVNGRDPAFVAQSSLQPDVWFAGDSLGFYRSMFKELKDLQ